MSQKTMMWKGVALVEASAIDCESCYFWKEDTDCSQYERHIREAEDIFGRRCLGGNFDSHVIYVPAPPQPAASDAEWVEAKVADMRAGCDRERGEGIDDDAIRAALLDAIKRGRGGGMSERDPHGKSAHDAGAKLDAGKNRLGLVMCGFARALVEVGSVGTYGANKYADNGWMSVPDGRRRYTDAMFRHLMAEAAGELRDKDTHLLHAAHAAWNALARLDLLLREREVVGGEE